MKNIKEYILSSVGAFLDRYDDLNSLCVALSGGADSVCLLHSLSEISKTKGFEVSAVHINHHIRGDEADRDAGFCQNLCKKLDIPLKIFDVFVLKEAHKGESVETAARRLRYDVFSQIKADYIATAHNADDSLETFLINFCRGTGLKGLTGIPDLRERFIRPLNYCSKEDILAYILENGLEYVTDSTNLENDYTRNKIRNKIIPLIKEFSPEIVDISVRNIKLLKTDSDFLDQQANKLWGEVFCENKGLTVEKLLSAHKAIATRVLLRYVYEVTGRYPDNFHLELLLNLCERKNSSEDLFEGYIARVKKGLLFVEKNDFFEFSVKTELISAENFKNQTKINKLLLKNAIDYDKIIGKLVIRTRIPNDRLRPCGRGLSKPVRRLQAEANIDVHLRQMAPVAADSSGILWGYKIGTDQRVCVDENTKNVLIFKVYKTKNGGQ